MDMTASINNSSLPEGDIDIDLSHDLDTENIRKVDKEDDLNIFSDSDSITLRTSPTSFEEDLLDIPDTQVSILESVMSFTYTYFTRPHMPYAKGQTKEGIILSWTRTRPGTLILQRKSVSLRRIRFTL